MNSMEAVDIHSLLMREGVNHSNKFTDYETSGPVKTLNQRVFSVVVLDSQRLLFRFQQFRTVSQDAIALLSPSPGKIGKRKHRLAVASSVHSVLYRTGETLPYS